jgi:signal peptidase I
MKTVYHHVRVTMRAVFPLRAFFAMIVPMTKREGTQRGFWFHFIDIVLNIVIIVAIVATIRTFIVSPFQVEGNSMNDTLLNKEYIIINKFKYVVSNPERGDIVVFHPTLEAEKYYVKRVIGLPGDTVVVRDGYVYLRQGSDDHQLNEDYLSSKNAGHTYRAPITSGDQSEVEYHVPDGEYFVLGDNRLASLDSRSFKDFSGDDAPFVPRSHIKGSVWFVALPITKIHAIEPPAYDLQKK